MMLAVLMPLGKPQNPLDLFRTDAMFGDLAEVVDVPSEITCRHALKYMKMCPRGNRKIYEYILAVF